MSGAPINVGAPRDKILIGAMDVGCLADIHRPELFFPNIDANSWRELIVSREDQCQECAYDIQPQCH